MVQINSHSFHSSIALSSESSDHFGEPAWDAAVVVFLDEERDPKLSVALGFPFSSKLGGT